MHFPTKAAKVVNLGSMSSQGVVVTLNKWDATVNTSDTITSKFEGWVNIDGQPFNRWNKETFHSIGSKCRGIIDIDTQMKASKIRVKAN